MEQRESTTASVEDIAAFVKKAMCEEMISIIIPVYKCAPYLRQCLDSILAQDYEAWEAILVDDGSTDSSAAIIDEYAMRDSRFRIVHKENGGVSNTRNVGMDISQGEWMTFVDGDDQLAPGALSFYASLTSPETDLVMAGYTNAYKIPPRISQDASTVCISRDDALRLMFKPTSQKQGEVWDKLFKTSIIEANNLRFDTKIKINEDYAFTTQYLCHVSQRIMLSHRTTYLYYIRDSSVMHSLDKVFNPFALTAFHAYHSMQQAVHHARPAVSADVLALFDRQCLATSLIDTMRLMHRTGFSMLRGVRMLWKTFLDVWGWRSIPAESYHLLQWAWRKLWHYGISHF